MDSQKVEVIIDGSKYSLVADTDLEMTNRIASYINRSIDEVRSTNKNLSSSKLYILTLMNLAGELFKTRDDFLELKRESKGPIEEQKTMSEEIEKLESQIDGLNTDIEDMKEELVLSLNTINELNKVKEDLLARIEDKDKTIASREDQIGHYTENLEKIQKELTSLQKEKQEIMKKQVSGE